MPDFIFTSSLQPLPFQAFWAHRTAACGRWIMVAWGGSLLLSIALGMASIYYSWSGIPITFGGLEVYLTIYPPLILSTLWVLWFGFWWGFIPAYLSTLILALYSGMPFGWSLLFAFADPLGLALIALAYRAIPLSIDLRTWSAFLFFVFLSFIAGIFGSSGSFIWIHTSEVAGREAFPIWQGWWLGAFLQTVLIDGPLLYFFSDAVRRCKMELHAPEWPMVSTRRNVVAFGAMVLLGLTAYVFLIRYFTYNELVFALGDMASGTLSEEVLAAAEGMTTIYWISLLLILATAFFAYQLFVQWTAYWKASRRALRQANTDLEQEIVTRRQAETAARELADELAEANAQKDRFFSIVAHDLRGPVSNLQGMMNIFSNQINAGDLDLQDARHISGMLQRSTKRLSRFLEDLLEWSRVQIGQMKPNPSTLNLQGAVEINQQLLRQSAEQKEVRLVNAVDPGLRVYADPNMLQSLLQNLLTNAIKFSEAGGTVHVTADERDGMLQIAVHDEGVGLTAAEQAKLFHLDAKFSRPGTAGEKGTGLGLVLCRDMIRLHGGGLEVQSQPGEGSVFTIFLPAGPQARPSGQATETASFK